MDEYKALLVLLSTIENLEKHETTQVIAEKSKSLKKTVEQRVKEIEEERK